MLVFETNWIQLKENVEVDAEEKIQRGTFVHVTGSYIDFHQIWAFRQIQSFFIKRKKLPFSTVSFAP